MTSVRLQTPLSDSYHSAQEGLESPPGPQAGPKSPKSLLTACPCWRERSAQWPWLCICPWGRHQEGAGEKPLGSSLSRLPRKADCPHPADPAPEPPRWEITPAQRLLYLPCPVWPLPTQREVMWASKGLALGSLGCRAQSWHRRGTRRMIESAWTDGMCEVFALSLTDIPREGAERGSYSTPTQGGSSAPSVEKGASGGLGPDRGSSAALGALGFSLLICQGRDGQAACVGHPNPASTPR